MLKVCWSFSFSCLCQGPFKLAESIIVAPDVHHVEALQPFSNLCSFHKVENISDSELPPGTPFLIDSFTCNYG